MMNKEFIKKQMDNIGISTNQLKLITRIGYATLSDFFNKENYNISAKHYLTIVNELFTPFEQLVYSNALHKAMFSNNDLDYWYTEFIKRKVTQAIKNETIDIQLSGAPTSDDEGVMRMVPAHTIVTFKDVEGKNEVRIFDGSLYRSIGKNGGKKNKRILVSMYLNIELSQSDKEFKDYTHLHFSK
ncbi:hypothetical protein K2V61_12645 [Staphylococcus simulans]|uniref:hypothetical protein n=1 Tax=Staphylococcus simulans TaxID=1286 RepID=UPI001E43F503|nr:hypothetical protein [Staphylococcus simulans]MCD8916388.1 hypothetical protein [Staphylococcus simulans]